MELLTAGQYLEEELRQGRSQASCRFNGRSGNAVDVCIKSEYASGFFFPPQRFVFCDRTNYSHTPFVLFFLKLIYSFVSFL